MRRRLGDSFGTCPLWVAFLIPMLLAGSTTQAASARSPGSPPRVLNLVRQTLKRGTAAVYETLEATIVRGYARAKIPLYWLGLQARKNATEILYLNFYDAADGADRAAATYRETVPRHPDLERLQQRLATYRASPPVSTLTMHRD